MRPAGLVLVIDGPRQVGCTTTVAGLQLAWPRVRPGPLLSVGLDGVLTGLGPARARWSPLVLGERLAANPGLGPLGRELIVGLHRAVAGWAVAGVDVALDHRLLDRASLADLREATAGLPVLHVGLVCDPDVLEEREREAGLEGVGIAATQLEAARGLPGRDLVLDTSQATTAELVEEVLALVASAGRGPGVRTR